MTLVRAVNISIDSSLIHEVVFLFCYKFRWVFLILFYYHRKFDVELLQNLTNLDKRVPLFIKLLIILNFVVFYHFNLVFYLTYFSVMITQKNKKI
jgi:hypothetical protein